MELLLRQFELDMMENDHMYECAFDRFAIKSTEIANMVEEGYFKESSSDENDMYLEAAADFIKAVKAWFAAMIEKVRLLVQEVISKVQAAQEAKRVKNYLSDFTKRMATDKSLDVNKKVKLIDTARYVKEFNGYIDLYIKEIKGLYSKKWENYDEYSKAYNNSIKKLEEYAQKNHLFGDEILELEMTVDQCVKYTEKELDNQKSVASAFWKKWKDSLNMTEKIAVEEDDQRKVSNAKSFASKLTSTLSNGLKKIISSNNARKIIGALAGVAAGNAALKASAKNDDPFNRAVVKTVAASAAANVGVQAGLKALDKKVNKNVDNDQTTATNVDNDNKSDSKN